jgi:hypothetical protein
MLSGATADSRVPPDSWAFPQSVSHVTRLGPQSCGALKGCRESGPIFIGYSLLTVTHF